MFEGLGIIVLVKQVPNIDKVRFDVKNGRLDRSSAEGVVNPFDLNALEAAVRIKENVGGFITVLSMGPKKTEESLRDTISRGADLSILLSDNKFAGADTLATSCTLSCAIKKIGKFDLIICGEKTIDGDTGQVGPEVAQFLKIAHVSYVERILSVDRNKIIVESKLGKFDYTFELLFPGLITVTKDLNIPRLPSLKSKLRSRKEKIIVWKEKDIATFSSFNCFGIQYSPTWVSKIYPPGTVKRKKKIIQGNPEMLSNNIIKILQSNKILR